MTLKKLKIISFLAVLGLTILFHFLYEWFPNTLFSILFPVNESIWEHMKLLYSGFVIWGIFEYLFLKLFKIKYNNYFYQLFIISISSIILYLVIYLPLYNLFGALLIINISFLIIVIGLEEIFSYYLLKDKDSVTILNKVSIIMIILFYFVFLTLTYNPPKNYLFYDTAHKKYGINIKS